MKQWFRTVLAGALLAGSLAVSAAAADYTSCADHLKDLGLFQGTAQGYELDRAPTRGEAAAMLVRLLGEEQNALALDYSAPFTDLQNWEKPYVQYLYDMGATTGVSETTFAPEEPCTAQMYAAFVLRALGYTEADGDFTYAGVDDFAQQIGLYDAAVIDTEDFLRDDVVAASYTALSLMPKDSEQTLLDQLVANGAVDAQAAEPYQALFDLYAQYRTATADMEAFEQFSVRGGTEAVLSGKGTSSLTVRTEDYITVNRVDGTATATGKITMEAPSVDAYTQPYSMDAAEETGSMRAALLYGYDVVPLACVDTVKRSGSDWTFSFAELPAQYKGCFWALSQSGAALESAEDIVLVQTVQSGRIAFQTLRLKLMQGDAEFQVTLTGELKEAR
ncbi:S-layer homology domain-containing protein [uncultured Agathobaculum sp.]|uniref:S-layer homology domain-containing protein n=1 Tax=uncultured Agathobaculum sp. TaxID=2048140 RepID=UPI00320BA158